GCWTRCPNCRCCTRWPPASASPARTRQAGSRLRWSWRWSRCTWPARWPRMPRMDPLSTDREYYGPYHGGPDPLAPPVDLRAAVESLGEQVMDGASARSALEELLRRGTRDQSG